jgi:hypothetical protein
LKVYLTVLAERIGVARVSTPQLSGFFASAASHTQHTGGNSVYTPGPLQTGHASVRLLTIPVQTGVEAKLIERQAFETARLLRPIQI